MSRTYRDRVSIDPLVYRNKHERRDAWKRNIERELEVTADLDIQKVYIITNEWAPDDSDETLSEVVGGKFFLTEDAAWDHLDLVAESFGVQLEQDETAFNVPHTKLVGLASDEYRIEELNR